MKAIQELSSVSTYTPDRGLVRVLFEFLHQGYSIEDCQNETGLSKNRTQGAYKLLKDRLIDGLFLGFKDCTNLQKKHIKIFKNFAACQSLQSTDKRHAWLPIATETMTMANKYGLIRVASQLADKLQYHYSIIECNNDKFKFYTEKQEHFWKLYEQERKAYLSYSKLVFSIKKKRDTTFFENDLNELRVIGTTNKEYFFNLAYRTAEVTWYQVLNDSKKIIECCKEAIRFFKTIKNPIPYTTTFTFQLILIPVLIRAKKFNIAENIISQSLDLAPKGGYNWHMVLILKAIIGFHTNKPKIAYNTFKIALKTKKKFNSPSISEQWQIVKAYLHYFKKKGAITIPENWRLGTFLNSIPTAERNKNGQNVSVLVIKHLHYLVANRKVDFMNGVEGFEGYIRTHLRGNDHIRNRAILRILDCVEKADYHPVRFEYHAKKNIQIIKNNPIPSDVKFIECEVMPFELVITEIRELLKRRL